LGDDVLAARTKAAAEQALMSMLGHNTQMIAGAPAALRLRLHTADLALLGASGTVRV
jgi:DNA mismatch repair protein MutH